MEAVFFFFILGANFKGIDIRASIIACTETLSSTRNLELPLFQRQIKSAFFFFFLSQAELIGKNSLFPTDSDGLRKAILKVGNSERGIGWHFA